MTSYEAYIHSKGCALLTLLDLMEGHRVFVLSVFGFLAGEGCVIVSSFALSDVPCNG